MSIAAIITEGIGPGSAIAYAITEGYDIGASPPPPPAPTVVPHDDYEYLWQRRYDPAARLRRAREDLGIIPKAAQRVVNRAVKKIIEEQPESARAAFDMVASYERHFRQAMRGHVYAARSLADEWREQVRQSLVEKEEDEVLLLIASWLL